MSQSASPDAFRRGSGPLNGQEEEALRSKRIVRSYIACKRCHTQKVKCSGETPCRNCKGSKTPVDCIYPVRDRKVAVSERYLKKLEGENQSLKRKSPHHEPAQKRFTAGRAASTHEADTFSPPGQSIVSEEDLDLDVDETHIQPYVGEAACTTFGTKLRRFLRGDDQAGPSRPRYYKNQRMLRASCTDCQLPNRSDAQLLVRVVLRFIGPDYHLLRRTSFLERLEETYKLEVLNDPIWLCRLFTVFALGEIYTVRSTKPSGNGVPGIAFFLKALDFFQDLYEEPTVEYIETLLLLSFYSTTLNRRNTAYTYIGLAMRLSMMLGLHRKIPESSPLSAAERQHRIRVWWTVYCLDRMMSSKLGHPAMMQDTDIDADLPSLDGLSPKDSADFYDPAYLLASISLARIVENVLGNIYHIPQPGRANTFVQGVQTIFTSLRNFQSGLPAMLRLEPYNTPMYANRSVASLHLHFNQCVILTTRPILFYVFRQRFNQTGGPGSEKPHPLPHMVCALSDACIQAARSSNQILSQLWVDGCLAMYGFYDALSIFSTTMVLMLSSAMSSIEGKTSPDRDGIGLAWSLLRSMKDDGNVPAGDYYDQLAQLKEALYEACAKKSKALGEPSALPPLETNGLQISAAASGMDSRPGLPEPQHESTTGPLSHLVVAHKEDRGGQPQSEAQMPAQGVWAPAALDAMFSANGTDQLLWDFDWDSVGML
ncbi:hypothetical protein LZ554_008094 [Drepanopeziza brunnea f. sp. 'monogermtubi']|nr:hypothetical protein LZ554_008094 [Drepanopeziza brunnea f. sp. 'monogermtubi']